MITLQTDHLTLDQDVNRSAVRFFFENTDILQSKNIPMYRLTETARIWGWNHATVKVIRELMHMAFQNEDGIAQGYDGSDIWGRM